MLTLHPVSAEGEDLDIARLLFREYAAALAVDLAFQQFDHELQAPLTKYGPPSGYLLLARWNGEPAGCIALQALGTTGVCEMKRLYTRPAYRYQGIGDALIKKLLSVAAAMGYRKMLLDTLLDLTPAIRLYTKCGFVPTNAYYNNPLDNVLYMQYEFK